MGNSIAGQFFFNSVSFLTAVLLISAGFMLGQYYYAANLTEEVRRALIVDNVELAKLQLSRLGQPPGIFHSVYIRKSKRELISNEILDVLTAINQKNFGQAENRLQDSLSELFPTLATKVRDLEGAWLSYAENQGALSNSRALLKADFANYQSLRKEFSELLNIESLPGQGNELDNYSGGVLAGLPRLKGLEDNIQEMGKLKDALKRAGGKVELDAPNPALVFNERIGNLKESSKNISDRIVKTQKSQVELSARVNKLLQTQRQLNSEVKNQLESSLILQVKSAWWPPLIVIDQAIDRFF